jgi:hypothetical protein
MLVWLLIVAVLVATPASASVLFGFVTKDAAYLSSTGQYETGGVVRTNSMEWITPLGENMIVGVVGDSSDCDFLRGKLEAANVEHKLSYDGESLRCEAMANYCRGIIAKYLRSPNALNVECMIAGCDAAGAPVLFWLDSIGSIQKVPYGAFGKDSAMVLSTLDRCNRDHKLASMAGYDGNDEDEEGEVRSQSQIVIDRLLGKPATEGSSAASSSSSSSSSSGTAGCPVGVLRACWSTVRSRTSTLAPLKSCQVKAVEKKGVLSFDAL